MLGLERSLGSRIVTYADDLVILCKKGKADEALQQLRKIMSKLKLTVNEEKTRICKVPEEEFDFLGYTFGRMHSARTGQARLGYRPSKKSTPRIYSRCRAANSATASALIIAAVGDDADAADGEAPTQPYHQHQRLHVPGVPRPHLRSHR